MNSQNQNYPYFSVLQGELNQGGNILNNNLHYNNAVNYEEMTPNAEPVSDEFQILGENNFETIENTDSSLMELLDLKFTDFFNPQEQNESDKIVKIDTVAAANQLHQNQQPNAPIPLNYRFASSNAYYQPLTSLYPISQPNRTGLSPNMFNQLGLQNAEVQSFENENMNINSNNTAAPFNPNQVFQFQASGVPGTLKQYNSVNSSIANKDNITNGINLRTDVNNKIHENMQWQPPREIYQTRNLVSPSGLNQAELENSPIQPQKFKKLNSPPKVTTVVNIPNIGQFQKQSSVGSRRRKQHLCPRQDDDSKLYFEGIKLNADMIYNDSSETQIFSEAFQMQNSNGNSNVDEGITDLKSKKFDEASSSSKIPKLQINPKQSMKTNKRKEKEEILQLNVKRQSRSSRTFVGTYKEDSDDDDNNKELNPIVKRAISGVDKITLYSPQRDLLEESNTHLINSQSDLLKETQQDIEKLQPGFPATPNIIHNNVRVGKKSLYQQAFENFVFKNKIKNKIKIED